MMIMIVMVMILITMIIFIYAAIARQADPSTPSDNSAPIYEPTQPPSLLQLLVRMNCAILIIMVDKEDENNDSDGDEDSVSAC